MIRGFPVPEYFGPNIYCPEERGNNPFAFNDAFALYPIDFPFL
jgi:hypothetical protein